jgi:5-dehydro-4-deoxyglucarate dehydratase
VKIGVIVYNRGATKLTPTRWLKLAERCPNLIGFKDGIGDIERMVSSAASWATASATSAACRPRGLRARLQGAGRAGVFVGRVQLHAAHRRWSSTTPTPGDTATTGRLLDEFFLPYLEIRNRKAGYAVSIVKAGAAWRATMPVRCAHR